MRNSVRIPIIPLNYASKDTARPEEFIVDAANKNLYAKSTDGLSFINFNEKSNTHIANADIHTTAEQKDKWTQDILDIFTDIQNINTKINTQASSDSPALTGIPTAPTATATTNTTQIATTAFVQAAIKIGDSASVNGKSVDDTKTTSSYLWTAAKIIAYITDQFAINYAMVFKGTIGTGGKVTALPTTGYGAGWTYRVITAGTYASKVCEFGDLIICVNDYVSGTASDNDWQVSQTNIDGAVTGSSTSVTSGHVPIFDGTTGRIIKTSGKALPTGNIVGDTSYGTASIGGVVKSSSSTNKITIESDGTMTTNLIDATKGGTGKTSIAINSMLYASAANVYSEIATTSFGRGLLAATSGTKVANLNADQLDGFHAIETGGGAYGYIPVVRSTDGGIELGKYIDLHATSNDGIDFAYRLNVGNQSLTGSGVFISPGLKTTEDINIKDKVTMQYNSTNETLEFIIA